MESSKYEIRFARYDEIPAIMQYIDEDWKKGHIMATNRRLFEYEFVDQNKHVNMLILYNHDDDRIDGCQGIIKSALGENYYDSWGSILKVRKECRGFHGIALEKTVKLLEGNRHYLGIGQNPNTSVKLFQKLFKDNAAKMSHYYRIADLEDYKIAVINHKEKNSSRCNKNDYIIIEYSDENQFVSEVDVLKLRAYIPYKNKEYLLHRYFHHPIYQYHVYGIYLENILQAIFVIRYQPYNGRKVVRIVDYVGNEESMEALNEFWNELFKDESVEYADFYEYGFSEQNLLRAGFILLKEGDTNIIPNYFGPFLKENVDIWVTWPRGLNAKFCKADGDQDRPSNTF